MEESIGNGPAAHVVVPRVVGYVLFWMCAAVTLKAEFTSHVFSPIQTVSGLTVPPVSDRSCFFSLYSLTHVIQF